MNRIVVILAIILLPKLFYAQHPILESYLKFPVLIKLSNGSTASGFYYSDSTHIYLVTAKHVFFDDLSKNLVSESAELISYPDDPYSQDSDKMTCNIKQLLNYNRVKYHKYFDVAVAQIAKLEDDEKTILFNNTISNLSKSKTSKGITPFTPNFTLKSKYLSVGTEIHIFGYPSSIGIKEMPQLDLTQPLLRRGIVAGKNKKLNTIIIDCPVYKGNSGGPVMASVVENFNTKFRLIGIVSQFVPFEEKWINDKYGYYNVEYSNSGYSIVAPVDIMLELIEEFK